jgi:hypothetical protein
VLCENELHAICGSRVQQDSQHHSICSNCVTSVNQQNELLRSQGLAEVPLQTMVHLQNSRRVMDQNGMQDRITVTTLFSGGVLDLSRAEIGGIAPDASREPSIDNAILTSNTTDGTQDSSIPDPGGITDSTQDSSLADPGAIAPESSTETLFYLTLFFLPLFL